MKRRDIPYIFLLLGILFSLSLGACKGAPPAVQEPPASPPPPAAPVPAEDPDQAPPDSAELENLAAARERAERAREQAFYFDAARYFPEDWENTEGQYRLIGEEAKNSTRRDVRDAIARYDAATAAFGELFRKSIPPYAQAREDEILEARTAALEAGAEELLPDFLVQADETVLEALVQYEAQEYYPAAASAILARDLYRALKTGAEAYDARLEIEGRGFYPYDPENFELADGAAGEAITAYKANDAGEARDRVEESLLRYNLVLKTGREASAAKWAYFAMEERQTALELKANVAVRQNFAVADAIYDRAGAALVEESYDLAAELFEEAGLLFVRTQRDTMEKRRLAEDAIKNAEEKMAESDEMARNAELILEGGAQ